MKQRLSEIMEVCLTMVISQKPNLSLGFTAYRKQPYRGTGMLSDGKIAQGFRVIAWRQGVFELWPEENNRKTKPWWP